MDLIKEINDLKREKKLLKEELALRMKPVGNGKHSMIRKILIQKCRWNRLMHKLTRTNKIWNSYRP